MCISICIWKVGTCFACFWFWCFTAKWVQAHSDHQVSTWTPRAWAPSDPFPKFLHLGDGAVIFIQERDLGSQHCCIAHLMPGQNSHNSEFPWVYHVYLGNAHVRWFLQYPHNLHPFPSRFLCATSWVCWHPHTDHVSWTPQGGTSAESAHDQWESVLNKPIPLIFNTHPRNHCGYRGSIYMGS